MNVITPEDADSSNLFLPSHLGKLPVDSEEVTLYDGPMVLHHDADQIVGDGVVVFRLVPDVELRFRMHSDEMPLGLNMSGYDNDPSATKILELASSGRRAQVMLSGTTVSTMQGQSGASGSFVGTPQFAIGRPDGKPESIGRVRFHVVNMRNFRGERLVCSEPAGGLEGWTGRARFAFGEWSVTLDALSNTDERWDWVKARGGCAFTHLGDLRRLDGKLFTTNEATDIVEFLYWLLSFANGRRCGCVLAAGLRHLDQPLWEQWTAYQTDVGDLGSTWFPAHLPAEGFTIAARAYELWRNKSKRDWFRYAVSLYTSSNNNTAGSEVELAKAQIALELLCWVVLREEQAILSEEGLEKLAAADRIRLLLSWSGIPLPIPSTLKKLTAAFVEASGADGPLAVTEIRNSIVHPTKKNLTKLEAYNHHARFEAWQLTQWYVEMVMLRLFNYQGRYDNRLDFNSWVGTYEKVPWTR